MTRSVDFYCEMVKRNVLRLLATSTDLSWKGFRDGSSVSTQQTSCIYRPRSIEHSGTNAIGNCQRARPVTTRYEDSSE